MMGTAGNPFVRDFFWSRLGQIVFYVGFVVALAACSAPEDDNYPGYCRLSCSKTSIAASNFTITKMLIPTDYKCMKGQTSISGAAISKWIVKSPINRIDGSSVQVERAGIAFFPHYGGGDYDPAYEDTDGVITPESEWCSDSCGVATLAVSVACPPADDEVDFKYLMTIQSGATVSESVSFTIAKAAE